MMWQYGTEISKPLSPIYVIYEYSYEHDYEFGYEYEYDNDYVNICGEISWVISTKFYTDPIIYVLVL